MSLAQGHNTVTPVRLEPEAPRSRLKHSTTEPLCSLRLVEGMTLIVHFSQFFPMINVNPLPPPPSHYFCHLLFHLPMFLSSLYCKQYGPKSKEQPVQGSYCLPP